LFDYNKATLRAEGTATLDDLVAKAAGIKLEVILVVGHTDRIGSDKYNQALSEKRAASVKAYLLSKGIAADRVYTEGRGKKYPVTTSCVGNKKSEKLIACLQPDRRVAVEVIGSK
jgi:OOP family OmpA-OmpF porin